MINRTATIQWKGYDPNQLPQKSHKKIYAVCDICGRGRWIRNADYRDICNICSRAARRSESTNAKQSDSMKKKWEDAEYRTKVSDGLIAFWSDKTNHDERVSMIRKAFEDPINRKKNRTNSNKYWDLPNVRAQHSALMKDVYVQNPDMKIKISISGKETWSNEEYRLKMVEIRKHQYTTDVRIKISCARRNIQIEDFNGFICTESHLFRCSTAYSKWRTAVFERDYYTCQECGTVGGTLNAHHILPYRDYKDVDISLDVQNGITLCEDCHNIVKGVEYNYVNKYNKILIDGAYWDY